MNDSQRHRFTVMTNTVNVTQALIDSRKGPTLDDEGFGYEFDEDDVTAASKAVIVRAVEAALPWALRVRLHLRQAESCGVRITLTDPELEERLVYHFSAKVGQRILAVVRDMNEGKPVEPFQLCLGRPELNLDEAPGVSLPGGQEQMTDADGYNREEVAYHEAGHAVIGWLCHHTLIEATIVPVPDGPLGSSLHKEEQYGVSELFKQSDLVPHPRDPDGWLVMTSETEITRTECGVRGLVDNLVESTSEVTAREMTSAERGVQRILDEHENLCPDEKAIMIAAAGGAAQRKCAPESIVAAGDSEHDWEGVRDELEQLAAERGKSIAYVRADLMKRTVELLEDLVVWGMVTGVAEALLVAKTMAGPELEQVIRGTVIDAPDHD